MYNSGILAGGNVLTGYAEDDDDNLCDDDSDEDDDAAEDDDYDDDNDFDEN